VVAISAGDAHSLALRSDGTVVGWGANEDGQIDVPDDLSNFIAISAGNAHSLALQSDGTVIGWGADWDGRIDIPEGLSDVVACDGTGIQFDCNGECGGDADIDCSGTC
jgi:alpha-tubulin suppressor-like RCC1 family protein